MPLVLASKVSKPIRSHFRSWWLLVTLATCESQHNKYRLSTRTFSVSKLMLTHTHIWSVWGQKVILSLPLPVVRSNSLSFSLPLQWFCRSKNCYARQEQIDEQVFGSEMLSEAVRCFPRGVASLVGFRAMTSSSQQQLVWGKEHWHGVTNRLRSRKTTRTTNTTTTKVLPLQVESDTAHQPANKISLQHIKTCWLLSGSLNRFSSLLLVFFTQFVLNPKFHFSQHPVATKQLTPLLWFTWTLEIYSSLLNVTIIHLSTYSNNFKN